MILYHGSKTGIKGRIRPESRDICDFGRGFYTGDLQEQPIGLIAGWEKGKFYELECNLDSLKIKNFSTGYEDETDWALFIAYNRNPQMFSEYRRLCQKYEEYHRNYDVITGLIANDKMYQLLERFFDGTLCDKALLEGLQRVKLGKQYVFKTAKACSEEHLRIVGERVLTEQEKKMAKAQAEGKYTQMEGFIEQLQIRYRRAQNVKYFDEILEEWNQL